MNKQSGSVRTSVLACGIILIIGVVVAIFFSQAADREQRTFLTQEAQHASLLVSATDVAKLSATPLDIGTPTYDRLKSQFTLFRSINPNIRFVYLMGYRPELRSEFFYVDSEPTTSKDYSPPGQIFLDTRQQDIDGFVAGKPYTDGPYSDSWGEWISGYAPVKDQTGTTVAMVGIDIATSVWHRNTAFVWALVGSITVLLCIVVLFLISKIKKKQESIETLTTENIGLQRTETKLKEIQSLAQLGKVTFFIPEQKVVVDEQFVELFKGTPTTMALNQFLSFIEQGSQSIILKALDEIKNSDIKYTWFDVRVGSVDRGYRTYHFYGNIDRDPSGQAQKFSGIMQDISDIQK